jgi:hypothetical protein
MSFGTRATDCLLVLSTNAAAIVFFCCAVCKFVLLALCEMNYEELLMEQSNKI